MVVPAILSHNDHYHWSAFTHSIRLKFFWFYRQSCSMNQPWGWNPVFLELHWLWLSFMLWKVEMEMQFPSWSDIWNIGLMILCMSRLLKCLQLQTCCKMPFHIIRQHWGKSLFFVRPPHPPTHPPPTHLSSSPSLWWIQKWFGSFIHQNLATECKLWIQHVQWMYNSWTSQLILSAYIT